MSSDDERFAGFKFSRQHHIGPCFADFCVARHQIIEFDGNQHAEAEPERADALRTACLTEQGYRVMRFWNAEVNTQIEDVLEAIYAALPVSLIARLGGRADKGPSLGRRRGALLPLTGGENYGDNVQTSGASFFARRHCSPWKRWSLMSTTRWHGRTVTALKCGASQEARAATTGNDACPTVFRVLAPCSVR